MFNTDIISQITFSSAAILPVIVAIIQVLKMSGFVKDKYAPFVSILVGIILAFLLVQNVTQNIGETILSGILYGLASSGLYSGVQTSAKAIKLDRMRAEYKDKHDYNKDRRK